VKGYRSHLDMPEAEGRKLAGDKGVLIKAGGNSERVFEFQAKTLELTELLAGKTFCNSILDALRTQADLQSMQTELVRRFGWKAKKNGPDYFLINFRHLKFR
jgi:hypothetical protein